jgi:hypothetical protein
LPSSLVTVPRGYGLRTTACPGSRDFLSFPAGPCRFIDSGVAVELRSNANPDAIICEHMETCHGATRRAFPSLNRQCIGLVGRRVSRLARTRISRQGLRAGSTNRCSGHVVPKVVGYKGPSLASPFPPWSLHARPSLVPLSICDWVRAGQLPGWSQCPTGRQVSS